MSKVSSLFLLLMIMLSGCKIVPFFISEEKKDERTAKRIERLEAKKKKAQYKLDVAKGDGKRRIKKLEKIESKLPGDTVVPGLDSASLAKEKEEIENLTLNRKRTEAARSVIEKNKIDFRTIKLKTKLKFQSGGQKQNVNAHFIIDKDKAIWVSIRIGLEVARAYITPDRVQAINRINKVYYDYSFDQITKLINVSIDFATLQDAIIGNAMGASGDVFELIDFGGTINIGVKSNELMNKLTYNRSDSTLRQVQLQVFRGSYASNILGMMSEYQKEIGRLVPTKRIYNVEDSKGKLNMEMEVQKVEFDGDFGMPYAIPKNYSKEE